MKNSGKTLNAIAHVGKTRGEREGRGWGVGGGGGGKGKDVLIQTFTLF